MMKINVSRGLSMAEVVVAIFIIGLAVGPLIALLSSSNRMSNASIYEEMAVHYAREMADQILRYSSNVQEVVQDAKTLTGDSSITFAKILSDSEFRLKLEDYTSGPICIPFSINGTKLKSRIIVSPLEKVFKKRRIEVEEVDSSANSVLKTGKFQKVIITIAWKDPAAHGPDLREVRMGVLINEN
jgi:uncharacterized membrane protein YciS (DUF1049 family)